MKDYKSTKFTNKITIPDGIDNMQWDEIARMVEKCETLATDLRAELEELAELMSIENCTIMGEDGEELDSYSIEDYANSVAEVEQNLDYESSYFDEHNLYRQGL